LTILFICAQDDAKDLACLFVIYAASAPTPHCLSRSLSGLGQVESPQFNSQWRSSFSFLLMATFPLLFPPSPLLSLFFIPHLKVLGGPLGS